MYAQNAKRVRVSTTVKEEFFKKALSAGWKFSALLDGAIKDRIDAEQDVADTPAAKLIRLQQNMKTMQDLYTKLSIRLKESEEKNAKLSTYPTKPLSQD